MQSSRKKDIERATRECYTAIERAAESQRRLCILILQEFFECPLQDFQSPRSKHWLDYWPMIKDTITPPDIDIALATYLTKRPNDDNHAKHDSHTRATILRQLKAQGI